MPDAHSKHPPARSLTAMTERLAHLCGKLVDSLPGLDGSGADDLEALVGPHLRQCRVLRQEITDIAAALQECRGRLSALPPPARNRLITSIEQSVQLLERAAEGYGRLTGAVTDAMLDIRRQLSDVQRGGKMLRAYGQGATILG